MLPARCLAVPHLRQEREYTGARVIVQTENLTTSYHLNGFAAPLRIHDARSAETARRAFDALEAAEGRERCQIGLLDRHFDQTFVWELATHPAILDAVEAAIGPDIMLLATHFFCKYPSPAD